MPTSQLGEVSTTPAFYPAVTLMPLRRNMKLVNRRLVTAVLTLMLVAASCSWETKSLVPPIPTLSEPSSIYAGDGSLLLTLPVAEQRDVLESIDQIPEHVTNAVVAIEDERFYKHNGWDAKGIIRAARTNVSAGGVSQGGSTITQQYVENTFWSEMENCSDDEGNKDSGGAKCKIEEINMARLLEESYSKDFILLGYLNTIFFGANAFGIQSAAEIYFDKDISRVTIAEGALLAGLIQSPSRLNPFNNREGSIERRELVLDRMLANDFITEDEFEQAFSEPLVLNSGRIQLADVEYRAAHFVEEVKTWFLEATDEQITSRYPTQADRLRALEGDKLRIETTVDPTLQERAEATVNAILPARPGEVDNPSAAAVIMDPLNGEVVAMVGGRDFFDDESEFAQVNLASGKGRQAGSSMKPIALAAAIDRAGIAATSVYDAPREITIKTDSGPWKVKGGASGGKSDLIRATQWSTNTVYAQLVVQIGAQLFVDVAHDLGIASDIAAVPAAALGTEDVTVLELTNVYATLANQGIKNDPVFVRRILDKDGQVIYEHRPTPTLAIQPSTANQISWIMEKVIASGTGTDAQIGRPAAGKTGTAQNFADATFAGYTPQYAAAVWVGYPEGQIPMTRANGTTDIDVYGGTYPARIWKELMVIAHEGLDVVSFPSPPASSTTRPPTTPLSQAPLTAVPDVLGRKMSPARNVLTDAGFVVNIVERAEGSVRPNQVLDQSPAGNTEAPIGSTVTIVVSVDPSSVLLDIPNVVGSKLAVAQSTLQAAGFIPVVNAVAENSDGSIAPGRGKVVWKQSPGGGQANPGASVEIWVNPARN